MSTPRTDATEVLCDCGANYVPSDVARNMEKALAAALARAEAAEAEAEARRLRAVIEHGWFIGRDIDGDWQIKAPRRYGAPVLLAGSPSLFLAIDAAIEQEQKE